MSRDTLYWLSMLCLTISALLAMLWVADWWVGLELGFGGSTVTLTLLIGYLALILRRLARR